MDEENRPPLISFRPSPEQFEFLEALRLEMERELGSGVSKQLVISKLITEGLERWRKSA
jgi:hypothetical protein